jgi:UDP-N-acetylglucosamine transferase subunit ALG13
VKFGDSRPLTDLLDLLASERKHDEIRSYGALKLTDDLALVEGGATFTKRGFASLCRLTSMPPVMVDWLARKDYKTELARFVNSELVGLEFEDEQNNRPRKRIFTRFREGTDGNQPWCRALFSDRYAVCDANLLIAMVADALTAPEREQARVHRLSYDGDELLCNVVWPGCDRHVNGEAYQVGIAIQTSEIGTLRMQVQPWIGRLVCSNGLIVCTPTGQAVSKRHVGKIDLSQLAADIRVTVGSALAQADRALMQLEAGRKVNLTDAQRVIIQLGRDHRLTTDQVKRWLRGHDATLREQSVGEVSAFSVINGLTRSAHDSEFATERTQLETLAGLLVAPTRFDALYEEIEREWRRIETRANMLSDEILATYL